MKRCIAFSLRINWNYRIYLSLSNSNSPLVSSGFRPSRCEPEPSAFAVALSVRFFAYFVYLPLDIGDSDANGVVSGPDEDIGASSRGNERRRRHF